MRKVHGNGKNRSRKQPGQRRRENLQPRVERVGPERFGIVAVDCGKPEFCLCIRDFYGRVLLEPREFPVSKAGLDLAGAVVADTLKQRGIRDQLCAVEMTGRYHRPVFQALAKAGYEVRYVHPLVTSLMRRSSDPGTKTDPIDTEAIHRAALAGLGMIPEPLSDEQLQWRLLTRRRRDLVGKAAKLKTQLKETIEAYLPGFTREWKDFWGSGVPCALACEFGSAPELLEADAARFRAAAKEAATLIQIGTVRKLRAWARRAAPADRCPEVSRRYARSLRRDLLAKQEEIRCLELELAGFLCRTPYVRLLAVPGIGVIAAGDYGAELGPMENYATPRAICGRAGLYPSRYQSCRTDRPDGPLVGARNRTLRAAVMRLAYNLYRCNDYYMALGQRYRERHSDNSPLVVVANRFSRLSYYIVLKDDLIQHSALARKETVLRKLMEFFGQRDADARTVTEALSRAVRQLPNGMLVVEKEQMETRHAEFQQKRRTPGVRAASELMAEALLRIKERLGEEPESSEQDTRTTGERTRGS